MVILHIAALTGDPCAGVDVATPLHVTAQSRFADAALWNLGVPAQAEGLRQLTGDSLAQLPAPYSRPEIAVFHSLYIPAFLPIAKQLKTQGIPYIIIPHGALKKSAQRKSRLKKAAANLLLFRQFCRRAAGIQCLTEAERRESVMGRNFFVAPNGIEAPPQTKTVFRSDATHFVYIGRILPSIKGLDLMIEAFAMEKDFLCANGCTLDIYGPGEDRGVSYLPEMRRMIAQGGVEDIVTLHPAVLGEEKRRILLDADIFIQTSRTEGMPMGILEAFSYGLPCLITRGTTFAEQAEERQAGWNAGTTAESIAAALRQAVADRSRLTEFSANAVRLAEDHDWASAAKTALLHYEKLLK